MTRHWAVYNEIDEEARAGLAELMRQGFIMPGAIDGRSIKEVQPDDYKGFTQVHLFAGIGVWSYAARLAGWPDHRPFWSGSCPCQPYSAAGKRGGADDPRHLWPDMLRLARPHRPPVIVGEQVAGSLGYGWLDGVQSDLEAENYASRAVDIAACGIDAPHIRNRLAWVAQRMADPDGGVGDGRTIKQERGPEGRGADGRTHAAGETMDDTAGARCGAGRSEAVAPVRDGTRGQQSQRRDGDGGADLANTDGSGELERVGRSEGLQPVSGQRPLHGDGCSGIDMVNTSGQRRGQGRAEAEIQRGRSAVASADVCERPGHMVDAEGLGSRTGLRQDGSLFHWPLAADANVGDGIAMGDAERQGPQGFGGHGDGDGGRAQASRSTTSPNGRNGTFWSDAEWLICHDGKARRAQPGIRLLADGSGAGILLDGGRGDSAAAYIEGLAKEAGVKSPSLRIPLWKTAGNSIVAPLFAEVLAAYMEAYPQ